MTPPSGAIRRKLPATQAPQLCALAEEPPEGAGWISEIKFDGYRLLAFLERGAVRLLTRNGLDWGERLPAVARAVAALPARAALLDGELVALRPDGVSSFPDLQAALSAGHDAGLAFFLFDLLHLDGWDLRPCGLLARKGLLAPLGGWGGLLRYSDHVAGAAPAMRRQACQVGLEGIVCKQVDAPYRAGRGHGWIKVKCQGREEFVVLGWTPPTGRRTGLGALHVGYFDPAGALHYAGGVGTGFAEQELASLRTRLDRLAAEAPPGLLAAGDPLDGTIRWVRPELVVEVQFIGWSGAGRLRHAVYLGLREDKAPREVVRAVANPEAPRRPATQSGGRRRPPIAVPPVAAPAPPALSSKTRTVVARPPRHAAVIIGGIELTHADRALWPGISKRALAEYWLAVAPFALPGLAHRPLAILRCPNGIGGEHFFQKRGHGLLPPAVREGQAGGSPYLAIDDAAGLVSLAQMSAIELHPWGAAEADALHPDLLVFDLDPGEDVPFAEVVLAAHALRERLERLGLGAFCRTTGGKGLHVAVPLAPRAGWEEAKAFCRAFAEMLSDEQPKRFLPRLAKAERRGRILIDWLRNGLGATAIGSFCPRARLGATVATPLAWAEVDAKLDPRAFTLASVPKRLAGRGAEAWGGFGQARRPLPGFAPQHRPTAAPPALPAGRARIVVAARPKSRR